MANALVCFERSRADAQSPFDGAVARTNDEVCSDFQVICIPTEAASDRDGGADACAEVSPAGHATESSMSTRADASPTAMSKTSSTATVSVHDVLRENHGTAVCKASDVAKMFLMLFLVGCAVLLVSTQQEHLVDFAEHIEALGSSGHIIFFLLFIWVGLPCGYNWSTVVILVGFAYGWTGIVDSYVGTLCSAVLSYYGSRYCLKDWMERRLSGLNPKKRLYLRVALSVIGSGRAGILMQVIMRLQPVQTFGLTNAFFGAMTPDLHIFVYATSTFLGMQYGIMMMTSVGILVRDVGSVSKAMSSEGSRWNLVVQGVAAAVMAVGVFFYSRHLAVNVLPRHIPEDAVIEVETDVDDLGAAERAEPQEEEEEESPGLPQAECTPSKSRL